MAHAYAHGWITSHYLTSARLISGYCQWRRPCAINIGFCLFLESSFR